MRKFVTCGQIKENEMGGARSTNATDEELIQYFGRKNLNGRDYSEDLDVDGKMKQGRKV
jgi:hypothetical protein